MALDLVEFVLYWDPTCLRIPYSILEGIFYENVEYDDVLGVELHSLFDNVCPEQQVLYLLVGNLSPLLLKQLLF
jgi:hypothetical protein